MSLQSKEEIEEFYKTPDPWGYKMTVDDIDRRDYILGTLEMVGASGKVLDIGAGEGFISNGLERVDQIEISDNAAKELINRVKKPSGKYGAIIAAGVLYEQYDYKQMRQWIFKHAKDIVLTCHYNKAGVAHDKFNKELVFYAEFPYREGKQIMRVYKW